jgi:protoporphyrinogen oxidase
LIDESHEEKSVPSIIILGAGPTGLACAHKLLVQGVNARIIILDRASVPGGAGASFRWKGHTLDYGPHAFHTRGGEPEELIRSLYFDNPEELLEGYKRVRVFLNGKFFQYPLKVKEALLKFNPLLTLKIFYEFIMTILIHQIVSIPVESFEDWGRKRFGSTLYRLSFGNYTEKVWKTNPNLISKKFASEKIQGFSFINLIKKLFKVGGQVTEPYYQTWIYPRKGSGEMFKTLSKKITSLGGEIHLESNVTKLNFENSRITEVHYIKNGDDYKLTDPSYVVNTLNLPAFIGLLGDKVPFVARHNATKLNYVSLILVYVEFSMERIGNDNWFYLLDKEFKTNRVTEQKNMSVHTFEEGKTVLSFELTSRFGDDFWNMTDEDLYEIVLNDCKKVPHINLNMDKITDYLVRRVPNVYECYGINFDVHAEFSLDYINNEIHNAVSIGRRGMFLQGDMHHSVEMGLTMGEFLHEDSHLIFSKFNNLETKKCFKNQFVRYGSTV